MLSKVIEFFELLNSTPPLRATAYMVFILIFTFIFMNTLGGILVSIFGKRPTVYVKPTLTQPEK